MATRTHHSRLIALCLIVAFGPVSAVPAVHAEAPNYQHGISLMHELKYGPDFEHFEYANPDAPKGGLLRMSWTTSIRNFSGARNSDVPNAAGLGRTFDRLLIRTGDELSGLYGWLAEGIALSADKRRCFVRLHRDARWHDGVPVTSADVIFSYTELLKTVFGKVYLESWIDRIEVVNDKEFIIHHRDVFNNANLTALVWFPIRPDHYYQDRDPREATLVPPVASGPYRITDFSQDHIVYERVDDYWGRDIPVNKGRFNFDEIRYDVYRDATVAREAFRKGLFDVYYETDAGHWVSSYEIPAKADGRLLADTRAVSKFIGPQQALALNLNRPHLQDIRVREALTLAMDFEWQNRVFHHGTRTRALSYFAGSQFAASGAPDEAELALLAPYRHELPAEVFHRAFELPVSESYGDNRVAMDRARELLQQAGWTIKDGVLTNAAGEPFTFEILSQNLSARRILLPYVEALSQLGIQVRLRLLDSVLAVNFLRARNFDAYLRAHEFLNPPMGEFRSYFGSATADLELGGNMAAIRNPVVDALIQVAEQAPDIASARDVSRALDRVLLWGYYHIPLHVPDEERVLYWNKFARPEHEAVARYEYLDGSSTRILDSWWWTGDDQTRKRIPGG